MRELLLVCSLVTLDARAAERALDRLLILPALVSAGEELDLEILDGKATPPGGQWTIGGATAREENGRLRVTLPAALQPGSSIAVRYVDPRGAVGVDSPSTPGVRVVPRSDPAPARIVGCVGRAIVGQLVCICGSFPPGAGNALRIDGKPAGLPVSASSRLVVLRLPGELPHGLHVVSGDPAAGFPVGDQVVLEAIRVSGAIDRNALLRGQATTMRLTVEGTDERLAFRIDASDGVIRISGGNQQSAQTSGGARNVLERRVQGVGRGDFTIDYVLDGEPCPCAGIPGRSRDSRGFLPARVLAAIPVAAPAPMAATAQALAATHGLVVVEVSGLVSTGDGLIAFSIPDATDVPVKVAALEADPRVRFAQPDYLYTTVADQISYARQLIRADRLDRSLTGAGVTVALIDTGADAARVAERADVTGAGYSVDIHGTLMAGVLADVAPRARILAIKACLADSPRAIQAHCSSLELAKGIDLAVQKRARVLNLSVGGPKDKLLPRLVDAAVQRGSVVVGAAGNSGPSAPPVYPAALDNVIAVTAIDAVQALYPYANQGGFVDLSAPGVDILGAALKNQPLVFSGTSPAAAYVSGVAVLMLQRQPALAPGVLQGLLEQSASDLGPPGKDPQFGTGLVDSCRAAKLLAGGAGLCR
jgi:subtilisin family serine protease